jgi:putative ATP-binding cassette transporter
MKLFYLLLHSCWPVVMIAAAVGGLSGGATIALIAMIHRALGESPAPLSTMAWAFAGICMVVLVTQIGSQLLLIRLSHGVTKRLSQHLCERIVDAPLRQLEEVGSHRLLAVLTRDVIVVAYALNGVPVVCVNLVTLVCGLGYLAWLSIPLFLAMALFLALGLTSYWATSAPGRRYLGIGREHLDTLMRHLRTMVEGVKELKIHLPRRKAFLDEVLESAHANVRHYQVLGQSVEAASISWGRLLFFVAIGMVLFGSPQVTPMERGALAGYILTILYLASPLEQIMAWLPLFNMARVSLRKIEELGLTISHGENANRPAAFIASWQHLELRGVTHTYYREREEGGFTLGPIDLTLVPGEVLFLVGGNGSGKTTLAKLFTGLYVPEQGEILLDGVPITASNREAYRQLFSAVFTEPVVFEQLLGMAVPGVDERAEEYLRRLHLDHVVQVRGGRFSTTALSTGQRKRLSLLAARLEDRPIYLFDEWAADQDPLFKQVFYRELLPELKASNKAVLVVTHDDRFFGEADRIIALADGRIVDGDWDLAHELADVARETPSGDKRKVTASVHD